MSFSPKLHNPDTYPTRFLVTRDPFSRLLSAYLDKFYLVDFWASESKRMVNKRPANWTACGSDFLRVHFEKMASRFDRQNNGSATQNETRCGKYVTFFEFVRDGFARKEPHWMPIHEICNPCLLNVTHVARMESFTEDARVILAKMGMEHILEDSDHDQQVDDDIQTIIDYNFNRTHATELATFFEKCVTPTELAFRLWHNFRWRGYVDPDVSYVIPDFTLESRVKEDLIVQIARARQSGLSNPARMKQAKEEFRDKAFQTIPKELFQKLTRKYSFDFKLFGYEDVRDRLFHSLFQLEGSDMV
ncbi:unnamed protein product [Lymnaea stagnalis]|uniref:Carbohydrate sulfotransferase n=1 Tax=Lymnaea stagnalis TaxID=6523 RepID=A0AAV2HNQ5_LYMST